MKNSECPAQDGSLSPDPYDAGILECRNCHLRYHHPCASLFRQCAGCGKPLETKRVFTTSAPTTELVVMKSSNHPPAVPLRVKRMERKPGKFRDSLVRAVDNVATTNSVGCLTIVSAIGLLLLAFWAGA